MSTVITSVRPRRSLLHERAARVFTCARTAQCEIHVTIRSVQLAGERAGIAVEALGQRAPFLREVHHVARVEHTEAELRAFEHTRYAYSRAFRAQTTTAEWRL